jgi:stalled ribosome rescue protein Dom34
MKEYVGLWIDIDRAIIVTILGDEHSVMTLKSHAGSIPRTAVAVAGGGGGDSAEAGHVFDEERNQCLQSFYADVLGSLGDPYRILVVGPGETKRDFVRILNERKDLAARLGGVEDAGDMTGAEIAHRTQEVFEGS